MTAYQWEYKKEAFYDLSSSDVDFKLTSIGMAGWELVSITPIAIVTNQSTFPGSGTNNTAEVIAIFKRPVGPFDAKLEDLKK